MNDKFFVIEKSLISPPQKKNYGNPVLTQTGHWKS